MDAKKDKRKNLERYKSIFFQSGLLISLAFILFAFEWKSFESGNDNYINSNFVLLDEELPPIIQDKKIEQKVERQDLKVVKDDEEVKKDVDINAEDNQKKKVSTYVPIKDDPFEPEIKDPIIYRVVEDMPSFPGGEEAMFNYLSRNINYPVVAKQTGIQGTVHLTFVVEMDGSISNVSILRGIGGGCDQEAMRVVKSMPIWAPGNQQGRPVRVQFTLPVKFVLQ